MIHLIADLKIEYQIDSKIDYQFDSPYQSDDQLQQIYYQSFRMEYHFQETIIDSMIW